MSSQLEGLLVDGGLGMLFVEIKYTIEILPC